MYYDEVVCFIENLDLLRYKIYVWKTFYKIRTR